MKNSKNSIKKYRLIFVSGCLDHISLPFCIEFQKEYKNDFLFISTLPFPTSRKEIGYGSYENRFSFSFPAFENKQNRELARQLILEADIVVYGTCPDSLISKRLKTNKLTFKMSERFYKTPTTWKNWFKRKIGKIIHYSRFNEENKFILCMGGYVANDLEKTKLFRNKRLVWGYFTNVSSLTYQAINSLKTKNKTQILWVGRFIDIKQPFMAISLANYLRDNNYSDCCIKMVGYGPLAKECEDLIKKNKLNNIDIVGPLSLEEKENIMNRSNIFIFTSNEQEGWGAVVNEAMGSACAVVATKESGAPASMIKNNENGLLFSCNSQKELNDCVTKLIANPTLLKQLQQQAYLDAHNIWTSNIAVSRLIKIINSIQKSNTFRYENEGPCSEALPK